MFTAGNRYAKIVLAAALFVVAASPAQATFIADGNLSSWGVTLVSPILPGQPGGSYNNYAPLIPAALYVPPTLNQTPLTGSTNYLGHKISWMVEDQVDTTNGTVLGPQAGGQNYDGELMAVTYDAAVQALYVLIVTGQRPDNGLSNFSPGDLRIDAIVSNVGTKFGVEVGGGTGHNTATPDLAPISEGAAGNTYTGSPTTGATTGVATNGFGKVAGSVWGGAVNWDAAFLSPGTFPEIQLSNDSSGTALGLADYYYSRDAIGATGGHAVIEFGITFEQLGLSAGDRITSVRWYPGCANDELKVDPDITVAVPLPGALVLLGSGLGTAAVVGFRRRKAVLS